MYSGTKYVSMSDVPQMPNRSMRVALRPVYSRQKMTRVMAGNSIAVEAKIDF